MTDWPAWSREAVATADALNQRWLDRYGLAGAAFVWDLAAATVVFDSGSRRIVAGARLVGTASACQGSFQWSWADDGLPPACRAGMDRVRDFGLRHGLPLLARSSWPGGRAEGLEMVAAAARILAAEGTLVDEAADLTLYFVLFGFREASGAGV